MTVSIFLIIYGSICAICASCLTNVYWLIKQPVRRVVHLPEGSIVKRGERDE